jgi:hypothetical protein
MPTVLLHGSCGKAGVAAHLAALRFFGGRPPVGVTVIVGGEKETGAPGSGPSPARYRDELDAAALVIGADPSTAADGPDGSPDCGDFENACVAEVLRLVELARENDKAQPPRPV